MRWKHKLILGGLAASLLAGLALAQSLTQTDLSGQECWNVGQGPGGTGNYICSNLVRGGTAIVAATPTGAITAGAGTLANLANGGNLVFGGQPTATTTLTTMALPADGAVLGICNGTTSAFATTSIALAANTSQSIATSTSITTLGAGLCKQIQYSRSTTTWYPIR